MEGSVKDLAMLRLERAEEMLVAAKKNFELNELKLPTYIYIGKIKVECLNLVYTRPYMKSKLILRLWLALTKISLYKQTLTPSVTS